MKTITGRRRNAVDRMQGGVGLDLDWPTSLSSAWPFMDMMKVTDTWNPFDLPNNGCRIRADQWLDNCPGDGASYGIALFSDNDYGGGAYYPPGTYKVILPSALTAAGWTVRITFFLNSIGASATGEGASCQYTIPDLGLNGAYTSLGFAVYARAPTTGGPWTLNGLAIYNILDEPTFILGGDNAIWNPRWLADLQSGGWVRSIRVKDWVGTDNQTFNQYWGFRRRVTCTPSERTLESSRTWAMRTWCGPMGGNGGTADSRPGNHVPYSVCAKLAVKLNCAVMIAVPLLDDAMYFDAKASNGQFNPCFFPNGTPVSMDAAPAPFTANTIYYVVNAVFGRNSDTPYGHLQLAATPGGAPIFPTADYNGSGPGVTMFRIYAESDFMALYTAIAQEMYAVAPGIDIIMDVGNETWNSGANGFYGYETCAGALSMQCANPLQHGDSSSGYAWGLMRCWRAFESVYPRNQLVRIALGQDVYFEGHSQYVYQYIDPVLYEGKSVANLLDAHCTASYAYPSMTGVARGANAASTGSQTTGYTWDNNITWKASSLFGPDVCHTIDGKNWTALRDNFNVTPVEGADWHNSSSNGLIGLPASYTDDQMLEFHILSFKAEIQYLARYKYLGDSARTVGPAPLIIYEGGRYFGATGSALAGLGTFITHQIAWEQGSPLHGTAICNMRDFYAQIPVAVQHQFQYTGNWQGPATDSSSHAGMKRAQDLPDNPGTAAYKRIRFT